MYNANQEEQKILEYWDKDQTFKKSVDLRPSSKPYVFYDGPPFATGLPHYGHIVASTMKDIVPRFWTMQGYRVERRWGWDCHGLPVENIIEKDLNLNSRRDIENFGVAKFNEACRATVLTYANEWKKTVKRMGRWVDMENDYKTMDPAFMESVWWVFKKLWDKNLIYKSHKAMHLCPRCATTLSNFEVTQGYKEVKDLSATAKFTLKETNQKKKVVGDGIVHVLAWTTTPWTLPGNVLLAVGADIEYSVIAIDGESDVFVVAKERLEAVMGEKKYQVVKTIKGKDLVGLDYEPVFPYYADTPSAFRVVAAEFVSTEDGTGIVHIAPGFGEDDYNVGKREGLPLVQHVSIEGKFVDAVTDFSGLDVKPKDDPTKADVEIIKWLAHHGKLFSKQKYEHSYPHCWRCDTPLLNYATSSWFVKVTELKNELLKNNEKINWIPEHIKEGRFGKWLEGARDWAISRSRYWGTPLPVWESSDGEFLCVGSIQELEEFSGQKITDLHKHIIDPVVVKYNGKEYRRIPEVLDCWFESGSMPYGQMHYPFENRDMFEASFPAEFIAEGQDQTRGWFYTLHVLATALTTGREAAIPSCGGPAPAFKNVIVNGIVLAEDGKKMSKRLKNYPEPGLVMDKYGADAMRYYLASSPVMEAESLNFSEAGVREVFSKVVNTLYNVLEFYQMFAAQAEKIKHTKADHVLDKWILAKVHGLVSEMTTNLKSYRLAEAARPILDFITELSQWYVRRSRDRFKGDDEHDKMAALATLREVLATLAKVMAPFTPFIAERVWQAVGGSDESVHLQDWPMPKPEHHETAILDEMQLVRKIVEMGLALRAENKLKVRQPLAALLMNKENLNHELRTIIADELNVKAVDFSEYQQPGNGWAEKVEGDVSVWLDTTLTDDLKKEGLVREIVRTINQMRKEQKLTIRDRVVVRYSTQSKELQEVFAEYKDTIATQVLAKNIVKDDSVTGEKIKVDEREIVIEVEK